jgi:hypothetical protein
MITTSTHAPRMIPSEHLTRQCAGMNEIFDLSLVKNISLGKRFEFFDHTGSVTCFGVLPETHEMSHWIKSKNPQASAVKREVEEDWGDKKKPR